MFTSTSDEGDNLDTQHRVAIFDRATLGGAAAAFAIVVSLGSRDNDLDIPLRVSMAFAIAALPLLISMYIAKDGLLSWRLAENAPARFGRTMATWTATAASCLLAGAIAGLGAHVFGTITGLVIAAWRRLLS